MPFHRPLAQRPELRSNRLTPRVRSSSEIALETTGCEIASLVAAFAMLPASRPPRARCEGRAAGRDGRSDLTSPFSTLSQMSYRDAGKSNFQTTAAGGQMQPYNPPTPFRNISREPTKPSTDNPTENGHVEHILPEHRILGTDPAATASGAKRKRCGQDRHGHAHDRDSWRARARR